jgi:DUF4097 and DUF4098 domain-containing protein YvlB
MAPVLAQDWPVPPAPPASEPPEVPEPKWVHGELRVVIPHKFEVKKQTILILDDMRGDLVIEGSDASVIVVNERINLERYRDIDRAGEAVERLAGKLKVDKNNPETIYFVTGDWGGRHIEYDYTIRIPRTFNLVADTYTGDIDLSKIQGDIELTSGAGDLSISDASGKIMVKSGGGDIDFFKVEGIVSARTGGGDIEGRLAQGSYTIHSGGGDIEFWSSKGNFDINTGGGDIDLQNLAGETLKAKTGGGDISMAAIKSSVNVMTGGGDIEMRNLTGNIEAATGGGDIALEKIDGNLVGYTGGGDFDIIGITGFVRARTNYGDITIVDMTLSNLGQKDSEISTKSGDIYLEYSSENNIQIKALLRGYKPQYGVERIDSNLDLDFLNEDGNTVARWAGENPVHTINIECTGGSIEIIKGDG